MAAVEKIEDQRKPEDFFGNRNRQRACFGSRMPGVRVSPLGPKYDGPLLRSIVFFVCGYRGLEDQIATCQWHVAATSANTGGFLYFCPWQKCKRVSPLGLCKKDHTATHMLDHISELLHESRKVPKIGKFFCKRLSDGKTQPFFIKGMALDSQPYPIAENAYLATKLEVENH